MAKHLLKIIYFCLKITEAFATRVIIHFQSLPNKKKKNKYIRGGKATKQTRLKYIIEDSYPSDHRTDWVIIGQIQVMLKSGKNKAYICIK